MTLRSQSAPFAAGVAVGLALAMLWFLHDDFAKEPVAPTGVSTSTQSGLLNNPSGAVAVSDQGAGDSVRIDSITVPPPGVWIAVRESSTSGLGNILGATRVHGPASAVTVSLLRATTPGRVYAVELYRDNGDTVFDINSDSVYVDFDTGARVVALFKAK